MPIASNFTSIFSTTFEINFSQCYPNGKLKHTELLNILQQTAAKHAEIGGISFADMQQFNQAWVMSKLSIEIENLPKLNDTIEVKTWIVSLENSRSIHAMEVFHNNQKLAGCETLWVVFNTKKRISESLQLQYDHFELFPNNRALQEQIFDNHSKKNVDKSVSKTILLSDIDNVNHVNNIKYLEWCLDLIDVNLILDSNIDFIEMNFKRELLLHDSIKVEQSISKKTFDFAIYKNNKTSFQSSILFRNL